MTTTTRTPAQRARDLARAYLATPWETSGPAWSALLDHLSASKSNPARAACSVLNEVRRAGAPVHESHTRDHSEHDDY